MMHFFKSKKFIIMIVSAIMMTSLGITANAESLLDQTLTYDSNKSAFLNYDPENDTYELLTEDGDDILIMYMMKLLMKRKQRSQRRQLQQDIYLRQLLFLRT